LASLSAASELGDGISQDIFFDSFEADALPTHDAKSVSDDSDSDGRSVSPVVVPASPTVPASRDSSLISSDISSTNILSYKRRRGAVTYITTTDPDIPTHYHQAIRSNESEGWVEAINKELAAMKKLSVWDVVELKPSMKTVGTTWVFRKKADQHNIVTFKARLCAQGFSQTHGIDFSKTFAPTGRLNSLRALISHAAANDLDFQQLDIKTAFLNADLEEEVYPSVPQGVNLDKKKSCLKLNKAIYGLKQAPLAWYNRLSSWLISVGFTISVSDPCVFYRLDDNPVWLFAHVDKIAVFGKDVESFNEQIKLEFDMKDLGKADLMLGMVLQASLGTGPRPVCPIVTGAWVSAQGA
jgi:hypothetical protein